MSASYNGDTRPVSLRVTEREYQTLRGLARGAGLSLNAYLRTRLGLPASPIPGNPVSGTTGLYKSGTAATGR